MSHLRDRAMTALGPGAALVAIAGVVALVTWPQVALITTHVGGHVDALFSVWRLSWIADSLVSPERRVFDAPIFYPYRDTLAYSDSILLSGLLTAPLRWLGASPVSVYNVYLGFAFVMSGFTAALLCHRLTGSWPAAAIGGVIFTLNPHRMEHFERLELITSIAVPLAFYFWHVGTTTRSRRWFAAAALCVALQWYLGMYQAIFLATVLPSVAFSWWTLDRPVRRVAVEGFAAGTLVSALVIAPSTAPYLRARQEVGARSAGEMAMYSGEWRNFLGVHERNWLYGDRLASYGAPERYFFPGSAAAVLAGAGIALAPRSVALVYGAVLIGAIDLTLGNNGFLFPALREIAPPYLALRSPARAAVIVMLPLAVFASMTASRILRRTGATATLAITGLLLATLAAEYRMRPLLWSVPPDRSPWAPPANAVLVEYPLGSPVRLDLNLDAHYMVARIGSWPKLLNGYSGNYPRGYIALLENTADFPSERAIAEMVFRGATHLVIHEVWLEDRYRGLVESLARMPQLEPLGVYEEQGGEIAVFRLGAARLR
jgi:hypothetical protein